MNQNLDKDTGLSVAKASFLSEAADLLLTSAPSTSAFLNSRRDREATSLQKHGKLRKKQLASRPSCKACGCLWTSVKDVKRTEENLHDQSHISDRSVKRRRARKGTALHPPRHILECQRCRTVIKEPRVLPHSVTTPKDSTVKRTLAGKPQESTGAEATDITISEQPRGPPIDPPNVNQSAKARAKARRRGGLQAQLEKGKSAKTVQVGLGLDLMDFMSAR